MPNVKEAEYLSQVSFTDTPEQTAEVRAVAEARGLSFAEMMRQLVTAGLGAFPAPRKSVLRRHLAAEHQRAEDFLARKRERDAARSTAALAKKVNGRAE